MQLTTRIPTIVTIVGLGLASVLGVIATPLTASAHTTGPSTQQPAPPGRPVNHPWQLRMAVDHGSFDGWTIDVTGHPIHDVKSIDSYQGPFETGRVELDYRSSGKHAEAEWTVDFFDADHTLRAQLGMTVTETNWTVTYQYSRTHTPHWMQTASLRDYYGDRDGIFVQADLIG